MPFAGNLLPSANNSPLLNADFFNFLDAKDMVRPSQGLPMMDMGPAGRLSSLEHVLMTSDATPSHMLNDTRCDSAPTAQKPLSMTGHASHFWLRELHQHNCSLPWLECSS